MDLGVRKYLQTVDSGVKMLTDYGFRGHYFFMRIETQGGGGYSPLADQCMFSN